MSVRPSAWRATRPNCSSPPTSRRTTVARALVTAALDLALVAHDPLTQPLDVARRKVDTRSAPKSWEHLQRRSLGQASAESPRLERLQGQPLQCAGLRCRPEGPTASALLAHWDRDTPTGTGRPLSPTTASHSVVSADARAADWAGIGAKGWSTTWKCPPAAARRPHPAVAGDLGSLLAGTRRSPWLRPTIPPHQHLSREWRAAEQARDSRRGRIASRRPGSAHVAG